MEKRKDGQQSGMAGEFLVAGKLFKLGYQVGVTMGNAKAIDLLVENPRTNQPVSVQVKTLRKKNYFPLKREQIHANHIYVFVILNDTDENETFYVISGKTMLEDINRFFGSSYTREKPSTFPGVYYKT